MGNKKATCTLRLLANLQSLRGLSLHAFGKAAPLWKAFLHSPLPDGEVVFIFQFSALTHLLLEAFLDIQLHPFHCHFHYCKHNALGSWFSMVVKKASSTV